VGVIRGDFDVRHLVSQVDDGSGHSGKRAPDVHRGLDNVEAGTVLNVVVRWRRADGEMRRKLGWSFFGFLGMATSLGIFRSCFLDYRRIASERRHLPIRAR
jgi:hypothetical protein